MDNLEKLATQGTQDEEKRSKNTTQYALDTLCASQHKQDKQLKVKTNRTSFLRGNRNGHHNTEVRT
jgi:hypothetical protein